MKLYFLNKLTVFFAGIFVICLFLCFPSQAENNYALKDAHFKVIPANGTINARWNQESNREEDVTGYKVKLYLNGTKVVMDWKSVTKCDFDLTRVIARCGKGSYQFAVYPVKGTEDLKIVSEILTIDDTALSMIKKKLNEKDEGLDEDFINGIDSEGGYYSSGWYDMPDGNYQYRDEDHKLVRSCFKDIDGITYYFSSDGLTLTGWQVIDQIWYYFGKEGELYKNTVTPDGCTVNELGQWVEEGKVVKAKEPVTTTIDPKTVKIVNSLTIGVSERASAVGDIYNISFANPTYGKITDLDFSKKPSECEPGEKITITMKIRAYAGCTFCDWTKLSCSSKLTLESYTVTNREISCSFIYTAGKQLTPITSVYTTEDHVLEWDDVPDAYYYYISVSSPDGYTSCNVYDSCYDYSDFAYSEGTKISIKAYPYNKKVRNIKESSAFIWTLIDDQYLIDNTIPGSLKYTESGRLYYLDEFGERVKGQTLKLGAYYYTFDENGYALDPGWHKDSDNNEFYYDAYRRMVLGDQTIDGIKYHFNAGERFDKPIGAMLSKSGSSSKTVTSSSGTTSSSTSTTTNSSN